MWTPAEDGALQDGDALTVIVDTFRYLRIVPAVGDDTHPVRTGGEGQRGIEEPVIGKKCTGKLFTCFLRSTQTSILRRGTSLAAPTAKLTGEVTVLPAAGLHDDYPTAVFGACAGWKISRGCVQQGEEGGAVRWRVAVNQVCLGVAIAAQGEQRSRTALQLGSGKVESRPAASRAGYDVHRRSRGKGATIQNAAAIGFKNSDVGNAIAVEIRDGKLPYAILFEWNPGRRHAAVTLSVIDIEPWQDVVRVVVKVHGAANQVGYPISVHVGSRQV